MYTILAIDDEQFNLDLIEATFSSNENIKILFANSAMKGLELLNDNIDTISVVLLDISMPDIDGLQALKMIRSHYQSLPIIMVTANHEKKEQALELGASDFITKPYDINELRLRTLNYAQLKSYMDQVANHNNFLEEQVDTRTLELQNSLKIAIKTEKEIASRLGRVSEYRDMETGGHIQRMSLYSKLLAELYGLDKEECDLILNAAPLHDVGKVAIPDTILLKPGRFDAAEFEIMKSHAQLGADILSDSQEYPIINTGRIIALEHHEKYDGSGYPNAKKGDAIHLYARIVAIADVFDALNSKRVYKDAMPLEKVLTIMEEGKGTHFDPKLLDLFLKNIDLFLKIQEKHPS